MHVCTHVLLHLAMDNSCPPCKRCWLNEVCASRPRLCVTPWVDTITKTLCASI